ncbi:MAG: outer membrane beta-barrel protein [Chitinophagaceae bacterium]
MLYLCWQKVVAKKATVFIFSSLLLLSSAALAQKEMYMEEHDYKPYYFGITLAMSTSRFHSNLSNRFLQQDSIMVAEPLNSGGFALGLAATARLSNRFEARLNPQLMFTDRAISYKLRFKDRDLGTEVEKRVESVIVAFPLQLKFKSDRIGNFRVYMLGGGKLDFDLASNAKARKADDMIKIGKSDFGVEGGIGFHFYSKSFIFSPEIKFSNGLRNLHSRDEKLKYSNVIDKIQSRMIVFSIHLEG